MSQTVTVPLPKRVRTPTILQMEAVECGAAALGIVLGYHGKFVPLEELRIMCGVSRDGTKASNLLKAARQYGCKAKGFRKEPGALPSLPLPLIVFWNFNHFLVVEGFHKDKVYLNDPETGPRTVSTEEFDHSFTGVALVFEPGEDFVPEGRTQHLFARLGRWLEGTRAALTYLGILSLLLALPALLLPFLTKMLLDDILLDGVGHWMPLVLTGTAIAALAHTTLRWLQGTLFLRLQVSRTLLATNRFLWHLMRLPSQFYLQRNPGELSARISTNGKIAQLLFGRLLHRISESVALCLTLLVMLFTLPWLTVFVVGIGLVGALVHRAVSRRGMDLQRKLIQERERLLGELMGGFQMLETLKASGADNEFFRRCAGYQTKLHNANGRLAQHTLLLSLGAWLLTGLLFVFVLAWGMRMVTLGHMTIGSLVAYQSLTTLSLLSLRELFAQQTLRQQAVGDLERIDDVLRYPISTQWQKEPHLFPFAEAPRDTPATDEGSTPASTKDTSDNPSPSDDAAGKGHKKTPEAAKDESSTAPEATKSSQVASDTKVTKRAEAQVTQDGGGAQEVLCSPFPQGRPKSTGALTLEGLRFGYHRLSPPLLEDFSLALRPGMRVALVGSTGSGKSTIARLVSGLHQPWDGEIRLDGVARDEIPRVYLQNSLAIVPQELFLFAGSIRDNLTMWDETIPEAQVLEAARDACIHDVITARPGGYDSWVQEGGRNFSGGQRQRLCIARALVRNPTILVLDEATSALDPGVEQEIDLQLRRRGCTCLLIAHRLSTIRDCDQIIVLDQGRVIERGDHNELLQAGGYYARLIAAELS